MVIVLSHGESLNLKSLSPYCRIGTDSEVILFAHDHVILREQRHELEQKKSKDDIPRGSLA